MKQKIVLLCLVAALALSAASCSSESTKGSTEANTVENNRVIGASEAAKPSASSPGTTVPHSDPVSPKPSASLPSGLPSSFEQSGSVRDEGEGALHLRLDWTAKSEGDSLTVQTKLYLECYSLMTSAKSGWIAVDGQKRTFRTEPIQEEENVLHDVLIHSESFILPLSAVSEQGVAVEAQWSFQGTYGEQSMEALSLQDTIEVKKGQ